MDLGHSKDFKVYKVFNLKKLIGTYIAIFIVFINRLFEWNIFDDFKNGIRFKD